MSKKSRAWGFAFDKPFNFGPEPPVDFVPYGIEKRHKQKKKTRPLRPEKTASALKAASEAKRKQISATRDSIRVQNVERSKQLATGIDKLRKPRAAK